MKFLLAIMTSIMFVSTANALTIPKGHVLGPDGNVYEGASPEQIARLLALGKDVGTHGRSIYVIFDGIITFIPFSDLIGKDKASQIAVITDAVTSRILAEEAQKLIPKINEQIDQAISKGSETIAEEVGEIAASVIAESSNSAIAEVAEQVQEQIQEQVSEIVETEVEEIVKDVVKEVVTDVVQEAAAQVAQAAAEEADEKNDGTGCGITCGDVGSAEYFDQQIGDNQGIKAPIDNNGSFVQIDPNNEPVGVNNHVGGFADGGGIGINVEGDPIGCNDSDCGETGEGYGGEGQAPQGE